MNQISGEYNKHKVDNTRVNDVKKNFSSSTRKSNLQDPQIKSSHISTADSRNNDTHNNTKKSWEEHVNNHCNNAKKFLSLLYGNEEGIRVFDSCTIYDPDVDAAWEKTMKSFKDSEVEFFQNSRLSKYFNLSDELIDESFVPVDKNLYSIINNEKPLLIEEKLDNYTKNDITAKSIETEDNVKNSNDISTHDEVSNVSINDDKKIENVNKPDSTEYSNSEISKITKNSNKYNTEINTITSMIEKSEYSKEENNISTTVTNLNISNELHFKEDSSNKDSTKNSTNHENLIRAESPNIEHKKSELQNDISVISYDSELSQSSAKRNISTRDKNLEKTQKLDIGSKETTLSNKTQDVEQSVQSDYSLKNNDSNEAQSKKNSSSQIAKQTEVLDETKKISKNSNLLNSDSKNNLAHDSSYEPRTQITNNDDTTSIVENDKKNVNLSDQLNTDLTLEAVPIDKNQMNITEGGLYRRQFNEPLQQLRSIVNWYSHFNSASIRNMAACPESNLMENISIARGSSTMMPFHEFVSRTAGDIKTALYSGFTCWSVHPQNWSLSFHCSVRDPLYISSSFRILLVEMYSTVRSLVSRFDISSDLKNITGDSHTLKSCIKRIAVDFEGEKLSRYGALRLIQLSLVDIEPETVYIIDIAKLGSKAMDICSQGGWSLRRVLESTEILKIWFDPRNDTDALYHQLNIYPKFVFDLQVAEVACRRAKGLVVNFVNGLSRCIANCDSIPINARSMADVVSDAGKGLYEPDQSGNYSVFRERPLHPMILLYSAYDVRYMIDLYKSYTECLPQEWIEQVLRISTDRTEWCFDLHPSPTTSYAPQF